MLKNLNVDRTTNFIGYAALASQLVSLGAKHLLKVEIPVEVEGAISTLLLFSLSRFIK